MVCDLKLVFIVYMLLYIVQSVCLGTIRIYNNSC